MEPLIPRRGTIGRVIFREISDVTVRKYVKVITDLIVHESALLRGSEDQFIEIEKDLRKLHSMLTVAEAMEGLDAGLLNIVDSMRQLLVHAEDVVDAFVNERERQSNWGCFRRTIFFFKDMIARHRFQDEVEKIGHRISNIRSEATSIGIRDASDNIQSAAQRLPTWGPPYRSYVKENDMMGLELHYKVIKSRLMDTDSSGTSLSVLSIVGMGGAGKTTLARKIYEDSEIRTRFPCRAWSTISQVFVLRTSLINISTQVQAGLQVTDRHTPRDFELAKSLNNFLSSERYLIVLDDMWTTQDWDNIRQAFPKTDKGSRIIVTTRAKEVALYTNPKSPPYELQLSYEDGWLLLKSKTNVPADLEEVGRAIVRRCMGSPLMISTVGTILSTQAPTREQWTLVLDQLKRYYTSVYDSLAVAADLLPSYLKQCLFYFGLFQEDYDIPTRRLIVLWVAEGLVWKDKSSDESPEVNAEKYLSNLIEQNLIQVVKRKPDGRVKTCRMHDVMRDMWVQKAKEAGFLQAQDRAQDSTSSSGVMIRRLADHLDPRDDSFSHIHEANRSNGSFFRSYYENLRTLLSFDSREGTAPGKDIGDFLRRGITNRCFQGMRVLDLERLFRPKLPESLGKLIHLRYLGLRWTYLENLPSSIHNLFNLQTLDLKHTYISTLPSSFWKMQQLRHLYLSESYRTRFVPPRAASSLTDLQTLWGAFVDEESPLANSLYRLTKLRKLGLTCQLTRFQQGATANWILSLARLESLRLISIDISVKPSDLYLESLSGLENLTSIYLLGRLTNPVVVDEFPQRLTELTLSLSGLREDPMQKLARLSNLKILRLLCDAFVGGSMSCPRGGFPLLQVLKLWKLKQLKEWEIAEGSLPILRELEIRSCTALQTIPEGLQHLELLLELKLKDMPEEFTRMVREVHGEDWYIKHVSVATRSPVDQ